MILHFVDSTPTGNSQQVRAVERFIRDLESSIGVKASTVSLSQTWLKDGPADAAAAGQPLGEYLKDVSAHICCKSYIDPRRAQLARSYTLVTTRPRSYISNIRVNTTETPLSTQLYKTCGTLKSQSTPPIFITIQGSGKECVSNTAQRSYASTQNLQGMGSEQSSAYS